MFSLATADMLPSNFFYLYMLINLLWFEVGYLQIFVYEFRVQIIGKWLLRIHLHNRKLKMMMMELNRLNFLISREDNFTIGGVFHRQSLKIKLIWVLPAHIKEKVKKIIFWGVKSVTLKNKLQDFSNILFFKQLMRLSHVIVILFLIAVLAQA